MATSNDPIEELSHDHRQLTDLLFVVREHLARCEATTADWPAITDGIRRLEDELLTHAAREEEGLFPFVAANAGQLEARSRALQDAHDAICGTLSRLAHAVSRAAASPDERLDACRELFSRFEVLYARHAKDEAGLLEELGRTLNEAQRRELRAALAGL